MTYKKNLQEAYNKMKATGWTVRIFDGELCLYKKISPEIDVEVSGLNNAKVVHYDVTIFVWGLLPHCRVIETIWHLPSLDKVVKALSDVDFRYSRLHVVTKDWKESEEYKWYCEGLKLGFDEKERSKKKQILIDYNKQKLKGETNESIRDFAKRF